MAELPARPDLDRLRQEANDLLSAASVSEPRTLASAQLAVAREYGFVSWARLETEVQRREIFDSGDVARLEALLAEQPELAAAPMQGWCDHRRGADPLGYLAMLRFDSRRLGLPAELPNVGVMTRALLAAGAPGGTALRHAAVFATSWTPPLRATSPAGWLPTPRPRSGSTRCGLPPATSGWRQLINFSTRALRSTGWTPTARPRCTRRRSAAGRAACATCWPAARTPPAATPPTAALRWAGAATSTPMSATARPTTR